MLESAGINDQRKRVLRPSELKGLQKQRSKRVVLNANGSLNESQSLFDIGKFELGTNHSGDYNSQKKRTPFAPLTNIVSNVNGSTFSKEDSCGVKEVQTCHKKIKIDWSVKKLVNIAIGRSIANDNQLKEQLENHIVYWRFPFPVLSSHLQKRIATLSFSKKELSKEGIDEREFFCTLTGNWRKALLSLYSSFKRGTVCYFYYIHKELTILFRRYDVNKVEAIIVRATTILENALKQEGINFELLGGIHTLAGSLTKVVEGVDGNAGQENGGQGNTDQENIEQEGIDQENIDPTEVRNAVSLRLMNRAAKQAQKPATGFRTIKICMESNVHCLVDYLLNQKDGKASLIIPELLSPQPFLFGTQCKAEFNHIGEIANTGTNQIQLNGLVLPESLYKIVKLIEAQSVIGHSEPLTEPFSVLEYKNIDQTELKDG